MKYAAVTSFNQDGYDKYGSRMIESFLENMPSCIDLLVFTDTDILHSVTNPRVRFVSLEEAMPAQKEFEDRHNSPVCHGIFGDVYDYRFDAVKFSHKPAAICAASRLLETSDIDVLIWFDGDIIFKQPVSIDFLNEKFPEWVHVGHFGRTQNHTEGGVIMFRISDRNVRAFIEIFWKTYETDQLFRIPAWTDCHIFDVLAHGAKQDGFLRIQELGDEVSQNTQHPIVNSEWFPYLDHLKGNRKDTGQSHDSDFVTPRNRIEVKL
jgi:hypothetical protein